MSERTRDPAKESRRGSAIMLATAVAIPLVSVGCDLALRAPLGRGGATYAAGALLSLLIWGLCMESARHPRRAVRWVAIGFLAFIATFGIGLQAVARHFIHAYLGRRALLLALGIPDLANANYVTHNALRIAAACAVPAAIAVGLALVRARRLGRRTERPWLPAIAASLAVIVAVFTPFEVRASQCLPPDVLWLNGTGGPLLYAFGLEQKPKALPAGRHEALPPVVAVDADAPSIVLVLGESVRRDAVCSARSPACDKSPRVDEAAPDRIGFARAFSTASCTELASTALWTGLRATSPPDVLARAPLVWDWAKARGYRTAYITSQNLLFQQSDRFLRGSRIDRLREARDRIAEAPIDGGSPDEDITAEAIDALESGTGPALVVVHHANTHAPYRQTPGFTPFPGEDPKDRYRNSVAFNDWVLGDLVAKLRRGERGKRAIVIFLSDHGEAWGEHGSYFHSFDLYEEQIDIPLWIDAPARSIPAAAMDRMRRESSTRSVAIVDVTATVLDLMGALDQDALADRARALAGASLLREAPPQRDVFLWNCPPTRECAADAFAVVRYPRKLQYVGHEQRYVCHDLEGDPAETTLLPLSRCDDLAPLLDRTFGAR